MGDVGVKDAADRVVAVVRDAGRDEYTIRKYQVVLERFAAFLTGRGVDTSSELVCIDFIANQTGVRLGSLREPVKDRAIQAVRRPVVLMADVARGHHEDDVLGNVRGMVADAFEMARDEDQIERRLDGGRVLQHIGEQLAEDLRLQGVELVVFV